MDPLKLSGSLTSLSLASMGGWSIGVRLLDEFVESLEGSDFDDFLGGLGDEHEGVSNRSPGRTWVLVEILARVARKGCERWSSLDAWAAFVHGARVA